MSLPKFYVGEIVIAMEDHTGGIVKGNTYKITGIYKNCACGYNVTVGLSAIFKSVTCVFCRQIDLNPKTKEYLFHESRFNHIYEDFQSITFEKVVEKEKICVN